MRRNSPERFFTAEDREAVRQAAASAESDTSGEIVPYVVGRCDDYRGAGWAAATLGALLAVGVVGVGHALRTSWGGLELPAFLLTPAVGALIGGLAAGLSSTLRRRLVPKEVLARRALARAETAFLEEQVFDTRLRTGILIFVAVFERRVVVLADSGINDKVEQAEWNDIVDHLIAGIRRRQPAPALVEAIGSCGRLLSERQVERQPDDVNELTDALRLSDE